MSRHRCWNALWSCCTCCSQTWDFKGFAFFFIICIAHILNKNYKSQFRHIGHMAVGRAIDCSTLIGWRWWKPPSGDTLIMTTVWFVKMASTSTMFIFKKSCTVIVQAWSSTQKNHRCVQHIHAKYISGALHYFENRKEWTKSRRACFKLVKILLSLFAVQLLQSISFQLNSLDTVIEPLINRPIIWSTT